jgi:hypothetical protein
MNPHAQKAAATLPLVHCAIYTRKSTEEGLEQEFNSLDAQPDVPSATTKQSRRRKPTTSAEDKEKRRSALDAAAKVLEETGQAMTCPEMIVAMAARGYWTSPAGKTPAATLSSALLREITTKGSSSRFVKTQRGKFAHTSVV